MNSVLGFTVVMFAIGFCFFTIALRSARGKKLVGLRAKITSFAKDPDDDQMGRTFFVGTGFLLIGTITLVLQAQGYR